MAKLENKKINVFFSYAHDDEDIKNLLDAHLSTLKRLQMIEAWNDRLIDAGTKWDTEIKSKLQDADIILLLISPSFNKSEYIWEIELKKAIENHEKNISRVIPIFAKECDYKGLPYSSLQGLPRNSKFIAQAKKHEKDSLLTGIVQEIRKIIEDRYISKK